MTGYITGFDGICRKLPALRSWDIKLGMGEPCDSFEVTFECTTEMRQALSDACRFHAEHDGRRVFTGVVDEFTMTADENGMAAEISGRSMAALLLDNEAEAASYCGASLDLILKKHVMPWGITDVRHGDMPKAALFTVESGASQWTVLRKFCWDQGGIIPRFDCSGTLILEKESGTARKIDGSTAIFRQRYSEERYGVISQVLVKNKVRGSSVTVNNDELIKKGGSCRRVINVTRNTGYDIMHSTGEYQIERSKENALTCEITLPSLFSAYPGDTVTICSSPLGVTGKFFVREARCRAGEKDAYTILTLTRGEE